MTASDVFVVDAHTLVWYVLADPKLSPLARQTLDRAVLGEVRLLVPTIVLAEMLTLSERRLTRIPMDDVLSRLEAVPSAMFVPLDLTVLRAMFELPSQLELHDRIIAATARHHNAAVLTRDPSIRGVVDSVW